MNQNRAHETSVGNTRSMALVHLITAVMKVLDGFCPDEIRTPGLDDFDAATCLLSREDQSLPPTLMTIQCLILKCTYSVYAGEYDAAYDAVSQAVRMCYQTGLNHQQSWRSCSPAKIHTRQMTFWSLFYLEKSVSLLAGAPYMIRDCDAEVDLPTPLPGQSSSAASYLYRIVSWARLSAVVWDDIFRAKKSQAAIEHTIMEMDKELLNLAQASMSVLEPGPKAHNSEETRGCSPMSRVQEVLAYLVGVPKISNSSACN